MKQATPELLKALDLFKEHNARIYQRVKLAGIINNMDEKTRRQLAKLIKLMSPLLKPGKVTQHCKSH